MEFFGKIEQDGEVKIYCANDIRRELFKLYYVEDIFDLYTKADPCEAIDKILTVVHHWISALNSANMPSDQLSPCKCFVHEKFFLKRTVLSKCICGEQTKSEAFSENMFAEIFVTDQIIAQMKNDGKSQVAQYKAMQGQMMRVAGALMAEKKDGCVNLEITEGEH